MTRHTTPLLATLAIAAALAAAPAAAAGLDCGSPPEGHPEADAALAKAITSPRQDKAAHAALATAIGRLKSDGVRNALIIDHAVAAYCPLVAKDEGLSLDRKQEEVRNFASTVTSMLYGPLDPTQAETAIILSLPVKPGLSDQIDAAAAKAGETRDAWLIQAIRNRLTGG